MMNRRLGIAATYHPQTKPPAVAGENTVMIAHRISSAHAEKGVGKPSTLLRSQSKIKALMDVGSCGTGWGNAAGCHPEFAKNTMVRGRIP